MKKLFRRLFLIKEIKSKTGELHFRRWRIISTPWFSIFVHNIYKADEDKHLHDHPWSYCNAVLRGSYLEETPDGINLMDVGSSSRRKAESFHKILKVWGPVTTLFMIGRRRRDWGYFVNGSWMQHEEYRRAKRCGAI